LKRNRESHHHSKKKEAVWNPNQSNPAGSADRSCSGQSGGRDCLLVIDRQFDGGVSVFSQGAGFQQQKETFSVLIGPVLTRKQFFGTTATASLAKTSFNIAAAPANVGWQISNVDADWFDESGQVESRIEAVVNCFGQNNSSSVNGLVFHVTILAAVAAWSGIISKLADLLLPASFPPAIGRHSIGNILGRLWNAVTRAESSFCSRAQD
jgi:hypothetical protein